MLAGEHLLPEQTVIPVLGGIRHGSLPQRARLVVSCRAMLPEARKTGNLVHNKGR
jgi:hypothetical protein